MSSVRRVGIVISTAAVLWLGCAPLASACNEPTIGLNGTTQAGPGQVVPFSFANTAAGATYTVSVNGEAVASGTASGPSVSSSFVMPNLGSSRMPVDVQGRVVHDDTAPYDWPSSASITYVPPTPSAPAPPASTNPPLSNTTAPSRHHPTATGTLPSNAAPDTGSSLAVGGHASTGTVGHASQPAAVSHALAVTHTARLGAAPVTTTRHQRHARAIARAHASLPSLALRLPTTSIARSLVPEASRANPGDETLLIVLGAALLAFVALGGGGAMAARALRRRRPEFPPATASLAESDAQPMSEADVVLRGLDVDAELRELLAEPVSEPDRSPGLVSR